MLLTQHMDSESPLSWEIASNENVAYQLTFNIAYQ